MQEEDKKNIRKRYEELKSRYSLPAFDALESDFGISSIEKEENLLKEIRKKIEAKLDEFAEILSPLLQPEPLIKDMQEYKAFNDADKKKLFDLYRKIMLYKKDAVLLSIESNDKAEVSFINKFDGEWKKIKESVKDVVLRLKDAWGREGYDEDDRGYMG